MEPTMTAPKDINMNVASATHARVHTPHEPRIDTSTSQCFCCTSGVAALWFLGPCCFAPCGACKVLPPRTEAVTTVFGEYLGTFRRPGWYCINPCGLNWLTVSVNNRAHELKALKCADASGNSIIVSGVIDAAKAILDVMNLEEYVAVQSQAVLKKVASRYKYITYDGSPSLVTEQSHLGDLLRSQLQEAVDPAGVEIVSFMLSDLAYAPEIATAMLQRQQAAATVDARKLVVQGAVGIACDALKELSTRGSPVAAADTSRFVSNLVMVICAERQPVPTIEI